MIKVSEIEYGFIGSSRRFQAPSSERGVIGHQRQRKEDYGCPDKKSLDASGTGRSAGLTKDLKDGNDGMRNGIKAKQRYSSTSHLLYTMHPSMG
mmetsp:Transcript_3859/g.5164  ORF Transcript_3859/g.5164 Transcript_3859/m.5164 type:complete len:94 (-) Transcript_3859:17-298(-)